MKLENSATPGGSLDGYVKHIKKVYSDLMRLACIKGAYEEQGRGRKAIAQGGRFGRRFIFQFYARRQRKIAGNTIIRIWSTNPFFPVFEGPPGKKTLISGKPLLWIPVSGQADRIGGTPAGKYPGRLFELHRAAGVPLLVQREGNESIPKYFGIESVSIPAKFDISAITEQVTREIPGYYDELMKGADT